MFYVFENSGPENIKNNNTIEVSVYFFFFFFTSIGIFRIIIIAAAAVIIWRPRGRFPPSPKNQSIIFFYFVFFQRRDTLRLDTSIREASPVWTRILFFPVIQKLYIIFYRKYIT